MLICNQVNYLTCDPACPHIGRHEAIYTVYEFCNDIVTICAYRDDWPQVQCKEAPCPATK